MLIKIINFRKYNPRLDVNKPGWFRLQNCLFENPDFYNFSGNEIKTWIYLLCYVSKKNGENLFFNKDHFFKFTNISEEDLTSSLEKLEKMSIIEISYELQKTNVTRTLRGRYEDVTNPYATLHNKTRHNSDLTIQNDQIDQSVIREQNQFIFYAEGVPPSQPQIKNPEIHKQLPDGILLKQTETAAHAHLSSHRDEAHYEKPKSEPRPFKRLMDKGYDERFLNEQFDKAEIYYAARNKKVNEQLFTSWVLNEFSQIRWAKFKLSHGLSKDPLMEYFDQVLEDSAKRDPEWAKIHAKNKEYFKRKSVENVSG